MTNIKPIIEDIKATVAPLMEKWIADRVAVIMELKSMYRDMDDNEEFKEYYENIRKVDRFFTRSTARYTWFANMGYSKGDYMLAVYESKADIEKKMEKQAAAKLSKIDTAVEKKINFDVTSVEKMYLREGKDGYFEGAWKVNGEKVFSFDTFYAGGYNIQCFHVRTKYKLK